MGMCAADIFPSSKFRVIQAKNIGKHWSRILSNISFLQYLTIWFEEQAFYKKSDRDIFPCQMVIWKECEVAEAKIRTPAAVSLELERMIWTNIYMLLMKKSSPDSRLYWKQVWFEWEGEKWITLMVNEGCLSAYTNQIPRKPFRH